MSEIRCGELMVRAEDKQVAFAISQKSANQALVELPQLRLLVEFLENHLAKQTDQRTSFRIQLAQLDPAVAEQLRAYVTTDEKLVQLKVVDISLTGISVESASPIGTVGEEFSILLSFEQERILLPATIVRKNANLTALSFHTVVKHHEIMAPESLNRIYRELELNWLANNQQVDNTPPDDI